MKTSFLFTVLSLFLTLTIFAQTRVVLIEQFSNSSCPPCGAVSPSVYAFVNANQPSVTAIAYHTQFPYNNDSMYFDNPAEATQRVNYYTVQGVPYSVLDGNVYNGPTNTFLQNMPTLTNNRLNVAPRYDIQTFSLTLNGNQLSGSFKFTSLASSNSAEDLSAHVVVIEKNVLKSSYAASPGANSETEYGYVMRKMIPDAAGTLLSNPVLNAGHDVPLNWTLSKIKNKNELRVVAFVQNNSTKEIYQAQLFSVAQGPVSVKEYNDDLNSATIFPNPAINEFTILFGAQHCINSFSIEDQMGRVLVRENVNLTTDHLDKTIDLPAGIYFVKVVTSHGSKTQKLVVTK